MDFILNQNDYDVSFEENELVWEINNKIVPYSDVLGAVAKGDDFEKLSVSTVAGTSKEVELDSATWHIEFAITATKNTSKLFEGMYSFHISAYAECEDEDYAEYEVSGAVRDNSNLYVVANSVQDVFDMLGSIFNVQLCNLESSSSVDKDEE